jgi:hypothetical protein
MRDKWGIFRFEGHLEEKIDYLDIGALDYMRVHTVIRLGNKFVENPCLKILLRIFTIHQINTQENNGEVIDWGDYSV